MGMVHLRERIARQSRLSRQSPPRVSSCSSCLSATTRTSPTATTRREQTPPCPRRSPYCGIFVAVFTREGICFFTGDVPYMGSSMHLVDGNGVLWEGGHAREIRDRAWVALHYGYLQVTYVSDTGEFVGRDRAADLPGLVLPAFRVGGIGLRPWSTLRVSLWLPILLVAVLPAFWLIRQMRRLVMGRCSRQPAPAANLPRDCRLVVRAVVETNKETNPIVLIPLRWPLSYHPRVGPNGPAPRLSLPTSLTSNSSTLQPVTSKSIRVLCV